MNEYSSFSLKWQSEMRSRCVRAKLTLSQQQRRNCSEFIVLSRFRVDVRKCGEYDGEFAFVSYNEELHLVVLIKRRKRCLSMNPLFRHHQNS